MADVVVVEDDEDVSFLMAVFLEQAGHVVRRARNGEEALAVVVGGRRLPDLIVMDVEMPVLDGPGMAARLLVENAGKERIPLVIVSGATGLGAVARRVGTPYFLSKPFDPCDLIELSQRALRERRAPQPGG